LEINAYKDGVFTSPTNGLYVFDWTIMTNHGTVGGTYLAVNGKFVKIMMGSRWI